MLEKVKDNKKKETGRRQGGLHAINEDTRMSLRVDDFGEMICFGSQNSKVCEWRNNTNNNKVLF